MATHFSVFVWRIPWTEKPGGLQSIGSQRVGHKLKQLSTHAGLKSPRPGAHGLAQESIEFGCCLVYALVHSYSLSLLPHFGSNFCLPISSFFMYTEKLNCLDHAKKRQASLTRERKLCASVSSSVKWENGGKSISTSYGFSELIY